MAFKDEIRRIHGEIERVQTKLPDNTSMVLINEDPKFMALPEHMRTILEPRPGLYLFPAEVWFIKDSDVIDVIKKIGGECFGIMGNHAYVEAGVIRQAFGNDKIAMLSLRRFEEIAEDSEYETFH